MVKSLPPTALTCYEKIAIARFVLEITKIENRNKRKAIPQPIRIGDRGVAMPEPPHHSQLSAQVGHKAKRRLRARRDRHRSVLYGLGLYGLVGWSVLGPLLLGLLAGEWLDGRLNNYGNTWTILGLLVGTAMGVMNAWLWIERERSRS